MSDPNLRGNTVYPHCFFLCVGNIQSGMSFYGPFNTWDKASKWGSHNIDAGLDSWNIITMADIRNPADRG